MVALTVLAVAAVVGMAAFIIQTAQVEVANNRTRTIVAQRLAQARR